jgi:hypothetical protein
MPRNRVDFGGLTANNGVANVAFDPFPICLRYRKDFAATRPNRITGNFFANELQDGGFCTRMPKYGERNARSFP